MSNWSLGGPKTETLGHDRIYMNLPESLYERLFFKSLLIRRFEERIIDLYPSDRIQSPVHLSIGQEPIAVGLCEHLGKDDWLYGTYRSHAFYIAKGGDLKKMMAELYGKVTGGCKGKAGSMHLAAPEVGFMGSSAVVSSSIPHAVGTALARKIKGEDSVTVAVFGDGATDEGVYHESLNFAVLHDLPVLFVCENNNLAVHSYPEARQAFKISEHAKAYGLPVSVLEDGYSLEAVNDAFKIEVDAVRSRKSPRLIEAKTFRYYEHVGPGLDFDAGYRQHEDCLAWQKKDSLCNDEERIEKYDAEVASLIDAAVEFAESSDWPGVDELLMDVL